MTTRVLLVDDVAAERRLMRVAIERSGRFTVVGEGGDGGEAVVLAGQLSPDLVVMDLSMPGVDGLEALPRVKKVSPASRVVILSGLSGADVAASVLRQGADAYLEKGLHPSELVAHLTRYARPEDDATPPPALERRVVATVDPRLLADRGELCGRLFDIVPHGILVEDANGTIRSVNPTAARLLGLPVGAEGTRRAVDPSWRIVDRHGEPVAPDQMPGRTTIATGEAQTGRLLGVERPGARRRWVLVSTVPLVDPAAPPPAPAYGVVTSLVDVTDVVDPPEPNSLSET